MSPAIVDSDEEGEDFLIGGLNQPKAHQAPPSMKGGSAPNDEQSTGSTGISNSLLRRGSGTEVEAMDDPTGTERLRDDIYSAERALFGSLGKDTKTEADNAQLPSSMDLPANQRHKRRSLSVSEQNTFAVPQERNKQSQTTKTSGSKQQTPKSRDDEGAATFEALVNEEQPHAPSRSSDQSSANASNNLPNDILHADFAGHEPVAMFKDSCGSGSTVPDDSSCQRRIMECIEKLGEGHVPQPAPNEPESQESSSIPQSAFEYTQSAESSRGETQPSQVHNNPTVDSHSDKQPVASDKSLQPTEVDHDTAQVSPRHQDAQSDTFHSKQKATDAEVVHTSEETSLPSKPRSSLVGHVRAQAPEDKTSTKASQRETAGKGRGRKRTAEQDDMSESLNSEDVAVGLPKERYNPRPSRRRATAALVEPIDLSVRPEKAAKARRVKTTSVATMQSPDPKTQLPGDEPLPGIQANGNVSIVDKGDRATKSAHGAPGVAEGEAKTSPFKVTAASQGHNVAFERSGVGKDKDDQFKKPAAKPKSSAKARRSHTTIFEDHVEFSSSPRSQTLRQQQAARASAMQDVPQEKLPQSTTKKRSRIVASSDDDDEDEIIVNNAVDGMNMAEADLMKSPGPPKRGTGRPPKSATKPPPTSELPVSKSSESREDERAEQEIGGRTTDRGRGHPTKPSPTVEVLVSIPAPGGPKAAGSDERPAQNSQNANGESNQEPERVKDTTAPGSANEVPAGEGALGGSKVAGSDDGPARESQKEADDNSKEAEQAKDTTSPAKNAPTPPPPGVGQDASTPKQKVSKTDSRSHSPIKNSSRVPLRVGLSKRQKIAPLLRMTKPKAR